MIAVWESDISATFLIFRLKCSTDAAFFKFLGKLFHSMAPLYEKLLHVNIPQLNRIYYRSQPDSIRNLIKLVPWIVVEVHACMITA